MPKVPYECFSSQHLVYDLIYNPEETLFLQKAKAQGATTINGISMLQLQAEKFGRSGIFRGGALTGYRAQF